jgi:hypothetical protein
VSMPVVGSTSSPIPRPMPRFDNFLAAAWFSPTRVASSPLRSPDTCPLASMNVTLLADQPADLIGLLLRIRQRLLVRQQRGGQARLVEQPASTSSSMNRRNACSTRIVETRERDGGGRAGRRRTSASETSRRAGRVVQLVARTV